MPLPVPAKPKLVMIVLTQAVRYERERKSAAAWINDMMVETKDG